MPPFADDSAEHLVAKALTCDPITIKANLYFVVPNFIQHSSVEDGKHLSDFFFFFNSTEVFYSFTPIMP